MSPPVRTAYVVSRFPSPSETFVVRELNHVARDPRIELAGLGVLFAPLINFTHPDAEKWSAQAHRPGTGEGFVALAAALARRPLRLLGAVGRIIGGCATSPARLARALASLPSAAAIARRFDRDGIEHVHAHFATYPALAAWLAHRLYGVTYSYTAHAHDIYVDRRLLDLTIGEAEFVVTISNYNRALLADRAARKGTPVELVHCGLDPEAYEFDPSPVPSQGPIRALCVASLQEYKGHRFLIEALADGGASEALARINLDLVGDGPLRAELERQVLDAGLGDRVTFHGTRDEEQVRAHLAESHIAVLPSVVARDGQMEGLPLSLVEAAACGLPIVASDISGIPELIEDGVTGILVHPADPVALRGALERLSAGPAGLNLDAARRAVESHHDVRHSAERIAGLIANAAARPGAAVSEERAA